jgi:tetratricopeptide (TPR) repeat protein
LWPVPVFILGAALLAGVWIYQPFGRTRDGDHPLDEDLATLRKALDPAHRDTGRALALGEELRERIDQYPDRAGEIQFLLGSAYVRRASEASREQAPFAWTKAREHLEQALALGVPDGDRPRLLHRLAQAWYHTGVEAERVLGVLAQTTEADVDDPADHFAMLTQLYLHLPEPNLQAALDANGRQLALPTDNDDLLAPARLLRGELLLQLNRADEARTVLARIRRTSSGNVYAQARLLRARSLMKDQLWKEAAPLWEEMTREAPATAPETGQALFFLGKCYLHLDQPREAAKVWERALQADSAASQAAALGLAKLRLQGPDPAAVDAFDRAFRGVADPAGYHNELVELDKARKLLERGCQAFRQAGDFLHTQQLARILTRIAPEQGRPLLVEVAQAWAEDCLRRAPLAAGPQAAALREEAVGHFRDAADAAEALAETQASPAEQARWLRVSAKAYLQGQLPARAVIVLQRFLSLEKAPERLGEGWFQLAEVYRGQPNDTAAQAAYHKCVEYPGKWAYRARYYLAQAEIDAARRRHDSARLDDAEAALVQNLELMRSDLDPEAHEKTLLALADLLMQRGNYRMAAFRLQDVLDHYPAHAGNLETRRRLADCYRRLAAQEDQNLRAGLYLTQEAQLHYREQRRVYLQKATAHYQKLADDLGTEAASRRLTGAEEDILRQAGFAVAECAFEQGLYPEAIRHYERLANRYYRQGESLKALQQIARCYWVMRDLDKARATVQRVRTALRELPDKALTGQPDMPSRAEWEKWLEWAEKQ